MRINYPARSSFLEAIEEAIDQHRDVLLSGASLDIDLALPGGYPGKIRVEIEGDFPASFWSDWEYSDPSRFPARIRATAWALFRQRCFGTFTITHDSGDLSIRKA